MALHRGLRRQSVERIIRTKMIKTLVLKGFCYRKTRAVADLHNLHSKGKAIPVQALRSPRG